MKKVKIMLSAIAVLAVVGGALAFKAKKFNHQLYCTTKAAPLKCTIATPGFSTTWTTPGQPSLGSSSCTTTTDGDCAVRTTYVDE